MSIFFEMPEECDDGRMDLILEVLDTIYQGKDVTLSFAKTKKISGAGHAINNCIAETAIEKNICLDIVEVPKKLKITPALNWISSIRKHSGFLSLDKMNSEDQVHIVIGKISSIAPEINKIIQGKFSSCLTEDKIWNISLILNELMQNAVDHSTSERYFIYAGINENDFEFGVLDRGVSIPAKMRTKYNCTDDVEYIKKSLEKEVGTRRERRGGFGLFYLFENLKSEEGKMVILSGSGQMRRYFKSKKFRAGKLKYVLRGTWIFARIPLEKK